MSDSGQASRVACVVVCYYPQQASLNQLLPVLLAQAGKVVVVDNTDDEAEARRVEALVSSIADGTALEYVAMQANVGVARGLNQGIAAARRHAQISHVLLFDQDSQPMPGMVAALLGGLDAQTDAPAVVGPGYTCRNTQRDSVALQRRDSLFGGTWLRVNLPDSDNELEPGPVATEMLISSGTLMALSTFDQVGKFDEALFIDHVDTDWCLRARACGVKLLMVPQARMLHSLGSERLTVWWGGIRYVPVHTPERLYYMFRNSLRLHRRSYAYRAWVWFDRRRLVLVLLVNILKGQPLTRLQAAWRGLREGMSG